MACNRASFHSRATECWAGAGSETKTMEKQITSGNYNNMHGNVSPDGNRIVFDSERSGTGKFM